MTIPLFLILVSVLLALLQSGHRTEVLPAAHHVLEDRPSEGIRSIISRVTSLRPGELGELLLELGVLAHHVHQPSLGQG